MEEITFGVIDNGQFNLLQKIGSFGNVMLHHTPSNGDTLALVHLIQCYSVTSALHTVAQLGKVDGSSEVDHGNVVIAVAFPDILWMAYKLQDKSVESAFGWIL